MRVPSPEGVRQCLLQQLIDRFNAPCGVRNCRISTNRVSDDFCIAHRRYYDELQRRKTAAFEAASSRPLHLEDEVQLESGGR